MRALVVDDDIHVYKALQLLIDRSKYPVSEIKYAGNGAMALEMLAQERFELIFSDMQMPGMDGVAFLQHLREFNQQAQVIVISGYNDFNYVRATVLAEGVDYLLKAIQKRELESALDKVMARREKLLAAEQQQRAAMLSRQAAACQRVTDFMDGSAAYSDEIADAMKLMGITDMPFRMALILLKEPNQIITDIFQGNKEDFLFCMDNISRDLFVKSSYHGVFSPVSYTHLWEIR